VLLSLLNSPLLWRISLRSNRCCVICTLLDFLYLIVYEHLIIAIFDTFRHLLVRPEVIARGADSSFTRDGFYLFIST